MGDVHGYRSHRLALGLTQVEVAKRAGLSLRALRNIEKGRTHPRKGSSERLAKALCGDLHDGPLWIVVLGPLQVWRGGRPVELVSASRRNLLGFLALRYDRVVRAAEIADVLWRDDRPPSWRNLIHVHINRLRGAIEPRRRPRFPSATILSMGGGYRLNVGTVSLDLARFDQLARLGRAAAAACDRAAALRYFEQALACWRGPVLADSSAGLVHPGMALSFHDSRLAVALAYADLALAEGRYEQVRFLLREIADAEPLHERVHAQLMLAMAGNGEQAAAIALYHRLARRLADELGIDPGQALRDAYLATLRSGQLIS